MPPPSLSKYRPDIDGLRALAVLAVVAFHAFPEWLGGGFIGVDIFFVISGYLITGIILEQTSRSTFSFADFYARRVRRIFPALTLVLLFSYAVGWLYLLPDEFKRLGLHLFYGVGFLSNFGLWMESGYFDRAAASKPLLHLWSLGIEEQFYVLWPALLYLAARRRDGVRFLLLGILLVSFTTNVIEIGAHPVAVFYSPLTRFWELLIGAAVASLALPQSPKISARWRDVFSCLGALFIVGALTAVRENSAFPGWWALMPTCGAALLIAAGPNALLNRTLFSNPALVGVGLISYPLYLWHWPLLSFARILNGEDPSLVTRSLLVILGLLAALFTYRWVERPLRFGDRPKRKVQALAFATLVLAMLGGFTFLQSGLAYRRVVALNPRPGTLGADARQWVVGSCGVPEASKSVLTWCYRDSREVPHNAIWGDSRADALFWGLVYRSAPENRWEILSRASCAPEYVPDLPPSRDLCAMANHLAFESIVGSREIKTVVLVTAVRTILPPQPNSADVARATHRFEAVIGALQAHGRRVVLVGDNPVLPDPLECLGARRSELPRLDSLLNLQRPPKAKCTLAYETHLATTHPFWEMVTRLKHEFAGLTVYDPAADLCDVKQRVCPSQQDGRFLYSYQDHISDFANEKIATRLLPLLNDHD